METLKQLASIPTTPIQAYLERITIAQENVCTLMIHLSLH